MSRTVQGFHQLLSQALLELDEVVFHSDGHYFKIPTLYGVFSLSDYFNLFSIHVQGPADRAKYRELLEKGRACLGIEHQSQLSERQYLVFYPRDLNLGMGGLPTYIYQDVARLPAAKPVICSDDRIVKDISEDPHLPEIYNYVEQALAAQ